jgi:hypothetical protein
MVFPTIMPANSVSGFNITNSVRFNDGDTPKISKTPDASNRRTWTISTWIKRSTLGTNQRILGLSIDSNNDFRLRWRGDDGIAFLDTAITLELITTNVFRDIAAWYHVVAVLDTTQGTASNRAKLYVNGVLQTSLVKNNGDAGAAYPNQNTDGLVNSNNIHTFGCRNNSGTTDQSIDGYIAETHFVDGVAKAPTDFGEFDDNGIWIPKAYEGTYGTEGWFFQFKQTGTGTNASGIGADTSGNGNHWAVTNLAATDVTTDTPTNNFATINSLANYFNPAALSEGNTRVDFDNGTSTVYNISTIGVASGKWYCEVKAVDVPSYGEIGIASRPCIAAGNSDKLTFNEFNYGYTANNGNVKSNNTGGSSYGDSFTDGDMIGIALDLDNNKLYFSKNGTFQNSGDPTTGATGTGAVSIQAPSGTIDGVYYFAGGDNKNSDTTRMDFNFGNPAFAISSGNADANGYGNFEYAVPSGYYSLCTKNLAEYGG